MPFPDDDNLTPLQQQKLVVLLMERGIEENVAKLVVYQDLSIDEAKAQLGETIEHQAPATKEQG